jgi:predicted MFS family arabinose efflux permease
MIVTVWNIAIAGGALVGGVLLNRFGAGVLPWAGFVVLIVAAWALLSGHAGRPFSREAAVVTPIV